MNTNKTIQFRLDAGRKSGMGHLSRNLAIYEELLSRGYQCKFLIKTDDEAKVRQFINSKGFIEPELHFLSSEIDGTSDLNTIKSEYQKNCGMLILDHYEHDFSYQKSLKEFGIRFALFDFHKSGQLISDIVINANIGVSDSDYSGLISEKTKLCVGLDYAIIRQEFLKCNVPREEGRILIAMGGGDYPQIVIDLISKIVSIPGYKYDLVSSSKEILKKHAQKDSVEFHTNPKSIAPIFSRNQIAIVAGGVTTYELAYLNVPMIVVPYVENQQENALNWDRTEIAVGFRGTKEFTENLNESNFKKHIHTLKQKSFGNRTVVDGAGVKRIADEIEKMVE